jgi:hypothetical protein
MKRWKNELIVAMILVAAFTAYQWVGTDLIGAFNNILSQL